MKKRGKGNRLQGMMAVLLSVVLVVGMVSGTISLPVFAEEDTEMLESVSGNTVKPSEEENKIEGGGTETVGGENKIEGSETETTEGKPGETPSAEIIIDENQKVATVGVNDAESEIEAVHNHSWSLEWTSSETHHWHECTAEGCTIAEAADKDCYKEHAYDDADGRTCSICGYQKTDMTADEGWELDADGKLTISSDDGMTNWIKNGLQTNKENVKSAVIQENVTSIGEIAFLDCKNLTSIEIPNSVTSIEMLAFLDCKNLTSIEIPDRVRSIGNGAFMGCSGLTSISIPSGVKDIGAFAFLLCDSLTDITISASVRNIGNMAFADCMELRKVTMEGSDPPELGEDVFRDSYFYWNGVQGIHVPADAAGAYRSEWKKWEDNITGGLGTFSTGLDREEAVPWIAIYTSNEELREKFLTEAERAQLDTDSNAAYCVGLEARDAGSTVSESDKTSIENALNGFTVGQYLDFKLYKQGADSASRTYLTEGKLEICIGAPKSLENKDDTKTRTFAVIRVHDGQAAFLEDRDNDPDSITIESDLFSTYAIVYQDTANGGTGGGNGGGGTGDGGNGSDNSGGGHKGGGTDTSGDGNNGVENLDSIREIISNGGSVDDLESAISAGGSTDNSGGGNGIASVKNEGSGNSAANPAAKGQEPKTGDDTLPELYATLAMLAGLTYLFLYFADRRKGMTEETKKELISRLAAWAKQGGKVRKPLAFIAILALLVYYHSIGKKTAVEWKEAYSK